MTEKRVYIYIRYMYMQISESTSFGFISKKLALSFFLACKRKNKLCIYKQRTCTFMLSCKSGKKNKLRMFNIKKACTFMFFAWAACHGHAQIYVKVLKLQTTPFWPKHNKRCNEEKACAMHTIGASWWEVWAFLCIDFMGTRPRRPRNWCRIRHIGGRLTGKSSSPIRQEIHSKATAVLNRRSECLRGWFGSFWRVTTGGRIHCVVAGIGSTQWWKEIAVAVEEVGLSGTAPSWTTCMAMRKVRYEAWRDTREDVEIISVDANSSLTTPGYLWFTTGDVVVASIPTVEDAPAIALSTQAARYLILEKSATCSHLQPLEWPQVTARDRRGQVTARDRHAHLRKISRIFLLSPWKMFGILRADGKKKDNVIRTEEVLSKRNVIKKEEFLLKKRRVSFKQTRD